MSEDRAQASNPDDADDLSALDELLEPELDELEVEDGELPQDQQDEPEAEPPQPRRPSARQRAAIRLRERLKDQEEENRRLRERLFQTPAPVSAPQPDPYRQAEMERQEAELVAQKMPHEQAAYYARKSEERMSQQMLRQQIETRDMLDRQAFAQIRLQEPTAERLAAEVEATLAQARLNGFNPTREALYNLLIGNEVRARAKKQAEQHRSRGRRQIAAQTTQPGGGRSTAATPRRRVANDEEAGLDDRLKRARVGDDW